MFMRFSKAVYLCAMILIATALALLPFNDIRADERIDNHVIIKIRGNVPLESIISEYGAVAIDSIYGHNTYLVTIAESLSVDEVVGQLRVKNGVQQAQPNFVSSLPEVDQISQSFPDETRPVFTMGASPPIYYGQSSIFDINSDEANQISTGEGVVVAVIDNGIALNHPLFENSISPDGYDFVDNDSDPSEEAGEVLGHGTFVAGIIKRIAPDCIILPIRAFNGDGLGNSFNVTEAVYYAIDQGADVINMSFSMYESNMVLAAAIQDAMRDGLVMVSAPGNNGEEVITYPCGFSGVIAVSAVDSLDYLADFSNYGFYLDVCAPGVSIYSSLAGEYEWGTWSGTSFSAAMVSGTAALIKFIRPEFNTKKAGKIIRLNTERNLDWGYVEGNDLYYGFGRVDALAAVTGAEEADDSFGADPLNILNVTDLVNYIYGERTQTLPMDLVADCDCSGSVNILDISKLINYIYRDGSEPMCK